MGTMEIKQRDITINTEEILEILDYENKDLIFLGGSLIEGSINKLSKGMGNKLSDIDAFILSDNINKVERSAQDYDWEHLRVRFKRLHGISVDIEIYSKQLILDLIRQLNEYKFSDEVRTFNILNLPSDFDILNFTSFIHRFLNGQPIHNENLYDEIRNNLNEDNYYKLLTRMAVNNVDVKYEDVVGNIESGQMEVAVTTAREILLETIKAYIFYNKTSLDRDKWIPLKIKNLAEYDEGSQEIYKKFKKLYFEEKLDSVKSLRANAERIIDFSNEIINKIGQEGGI